MPSRSCEKKVEHKGVQYAGQTLEMRSEATWSLINTLPQYVVLMLPTILSLMQPGLMIGLNSEVPLHHYTFYTFVLIGGEKSSNQPNVLKLSYLAFYM
jgi:hypothetical protein